MRRALALSAIGAIMTGGTLAASASTANAAVMNWRCDGTTRIFVSINDDMTIGYGEWHNSRFCGGSGV